MSPNQTILYIAMAGCAAPFAPATAAESRQRLLILADMGNEPDEQQQVVHMLVCCNEFDLEGLVAVTGKFLRETARSEYSASCTPSCFTSLSTATRRCCPT